MNHQNAPEPASTRKAVLLEPGDGRAYPMGRIGAVFTADGRGRLNLYERDGPRSVRS
jgi:hypothetical protein